ncbi:MAG: signal transduction protein, partial [Chlorobium sp.]
MPDSSEFPPEELLIFIGHSDDASAEANAILELQSEIEKDFRLLLKSNGHRSLFKRIRLWEWTLDALALTGGQERAVTPALDRAQIAIFVFRERVGKVTWEELEKARKGSQAVQPHVFAVFPEAAPTQAKNLAPQKKRQAAQDWLNLLDHQDALTADWTNPDSCSVTPCPTYQDAEELKTIVREKVRIAIADILSVDITSPTVELSNHAEELRRYQGALKTELGTISLLG